MAELFGMDKELELEQEAEEDDNLMTMEEAKAKRKPFAYWTVGGKEYKLKLPTEQICRLEEKYRTNLLNLLTGSNGIPPLGVMLTVIQSAAVLWNHGVKYRDLQKLFDQYADEGGTQLTLYADVIMQILMVSGFFTESQREEMTEKVDEAREML